MAINLLGGMRMPGVVSGYGGGTFDIDGTQVTPVDDFPQPSMPRQNVMAETARPQTPQQGNQQPQRRRPNFLEVVGRIGDTMALMGGRDPLFERFQAKERAAQEEAEQRNILAQFVGQNAALKPFAPLLSIKGFGVPELAKLADIAAAPKDDMTPIMREVAAATGFQPGTPEYRAALATEMNNRRLSGALIGGPDTGYQMNPLYRPLGQAPAAMAPQPTRAPAPTSQQGQAGNVMTMSDLQTMARSFPNADTMMRWMKGNNVAVRVSSPQEATNLPSGTRIVTPDGREKVVP